MRLVRYLWMLSVVLSTSAWAAPTQADLPVAWAQAALHVQPPTERDLRVSVAACAGAVQGAAARTCDGWSARIDAHRCGPGLGCRPWVGRGTGDLRTGMPGAWSTRGQLKVAFSNGAERDDRQQAVASHCAARLADVPAGTQPRPRDCVG